MTTSSPNKVFFSNTTERSTTKEQQRRSKYAQIDDTPAARRAYNRHDGGITPDEVTDDISAELEQLKSSYYETRVAITEEDATKLEEQTTQQADRQYERRKRIMASRVGGIAKMKKNNTKR